MIRIMISGCNGKMGQVVTAMCAGRDGLEIVAGVDAHTEKKNEYPVYADPMECPEAVDCVIDFSNPAALPSLLSYCKKSGSAIVLATTGYGEAQLQQIEEAAKKLRIFRSANMSLGINVLISLVRQAAKVLGDTCDIEIVEKHHNRKLDAPSGTALMIADAAASSLPQMPDYIYERHSVRAPRKRQEIGISSVRGGTIVGEHEIMFAGTDEVLEIKHTAYSREIFANGAIKAAEFLAARKQPGLYNMEDLVSEVV